MDLARAHRGRRPTLAVSSYRLQLPRIGRIPFVSRLLGITTDHLYRNIETIGGLDPETASRIFAVKQMSNEGDRSALLVEASFPRNVVELRLRPIG